MSHYINDQLLERASYVKEAYVGTVLGGMVEQAINNSDLELLERLVKEAEFEMAIEAFHNANALSESEPYED